MSSTNTQQQIDMNEALQFCIDVAYEAGALALSFCNNRPRPPKGASTEEQNRLTQEILSEVNGDSKLKVEHKPDATLVTIADKKVNEFIVSKLRERFPQPQARVIGEESVCTVAEDLSHGDVFYVDPIDGTKDFIRNNGEWAVMIGLTREGRAKMGVVYHAEEDHMYYATEGGGCYVIRGRGTEPVRLQRNNGVDAKKASDMVLITSRSHPDVHIDAVAQKLGVARGIVMGSFGLKCARFAEGVCDLYINTRSSYWDSVPSEVIVRESGGVLVYVAPGEEPGRILYDGKSTENKGIRVACPGEFLNDVVARIRKEFPSIGL